MEHVKAFYSSLYQAAPSCNNPFADNFFKHCPVLDPILQQQLSTPIALPELRDTLKTCQEGAACQLKTLFLRAQTI